jgi:hypothetical protein
MCGPDNRNFTFETSSPDSLGFMREIAYVAATLWGASFAVVTLWFSFDEWKYRRNIHQSATSVAVAGRKVAAEDGVRTDHASSNSTHDRQPALV